MEDNLVQKANALIHASYSMTQVEQQLLMAAISRLDPQNGNISDPVEITVAEMQDIFYTSIEKKNAYRDIELAANRIFEREIWFGHPDDDEYSRLRWIYRLDIDKKKNLVRLQFNESLEPFLMTLKANYTSYRLRYAAQLTSVYAIRIYELIASWYGQGRSYWEIELDELRRILAITNKYKQIVELKRRVIGIAVKQINESSDFELKVSYRKLGRSFKSIQFIFHRKKEIEEKETARKLKRIGQQQHNEAAKQRRIEAEIQEKEETQKIEVENNKKILFNKRLEEIKQVFSSFPKGTIFTGVKSGKSYVANEDNLIFFANTGNDPISIGIKGLEEIQKMIAKEILTVEQEIIK